MNKKVSYRQLHREAQKLFDENQRLKKELNGLINIMFGFAIKLYKLTPNDESFAKLKPEFLEKVKNAASNPVQQKG